MALYLLFEAAHGYALFEVFTLYCAETCNSTHLAVAGHCRVALDSAQPAQVVHNPAGGHPPAATQPTPNGIHIRLHATQVKQADELAQGSGAAASLTSDLGRFSKAVALTGFTPFSTAAQVHADSTRCTVVHANKNIAPCYCVQGHRARRLHDSSLRKFDLVRPSQPPCSACGFNMLLCFATINSFPRRPRSAASTLLHAAPASLNIKPH